jgi:hypothetical protein
MAAAPLTPGSSDTPDAPPERAENTARGRRLLLFTKPGVPGRVKTRLTTELTSEEAAAVHRAFVDDLLERLARGEFDLRIAWALDPGEAIPPLDAALDPALDLAAGALRQQGADLGERLFRGLGAAATADGGAAVVGALGSDHPTVDLDVLGEAFERVEAGADAVLGPSLDGGYYLIVVSARALRPELFAGIDWSTERVLEQTVARIEAAGLRLERVAAALDVDTPDDLRRLAAELAGADPGLCPRTRRVLARLGWAADAVPGPDGARSWNGA